MKKLMIFSALALASSFAFAGMDNSNERQQNEHSKMMNKESRFAAELGLTDQQKAQIKEIRAKYKTQEEAQRNEIKSVLTPEQQVKADALHKKMKEKRMHHKKEM